MRSLCLYPIGFFSITNDERRKKYLVAYERYKLIEVDLVKSNNYIQLLMLYENIIMLLYDFDYMKMDMYRDKVLSLIRKTEVTENQKWLTYMNLGTIYIFRKEYDFCILCLKKALQYSDKLMLRAYICICHAYHMVNTKIPHLYIASEEKAKGDSVEWIVYCFFKYMETRTIDENKKYILYKALPALRKNDTLYLEIMRKEIKYLCKISKGYKALYDFDNEVSKK